MELLWRDFWWDPPPAPATKLTRPAFNFYTEGNIMLTSGPNDNRGGFRVHTSLICLAYLWSFVVWLMVGVVALKRGWPCCVWGWLLNPCCRCVKGFHLVNGHGNTGLSLFPPRQAWGWILLMVMIPYVSSDIRCWWQGYSIFIACTSHSTGLTRYHILQRVWDHPTYTQRCSSFHRWLVIWIKMLVGVR